MYVPRENKNRTATPPAAARDTAILRLFRRVPKRTRSKRPDLLDELGDRFPELGTLTCRDPFKMHPAIESEKLHRIDYVPHLLLGVDIAVDVVAAAVGGIL